MTYMELKALYPHIDDFLSRASDQLHDNQNRETVLTNLSMQVGQDFPKKHWRVVMERLTRWVDAIVFSLQSSEPTPDQEGDPPPEPIAEPAPLPLSHPERCPHCGSLERLGTCCAWCSG